MRTGVMDAEYARREYAAWAEQAGFLVQSHAVHFERVRVPLAQAVSRYENLPLSAIRGWREAADPLKQ